MDGRTTFLTLVRISARIPTAPAEGFPSSSLCFQARVISTQISLQSLFVCHLQCVYVRKIRSYLFRNTDSVVKCISRFIHTKIRKWTIFQDAYLCSRKVAGSIPDDATGIFHWYHSGRTMVQESTRPLTEIFWEQSWPLCRANNLTNFLCRLSWNLGAPNSWIPQGLSRPVQELLSSHLPPLHSSDIFCSEAYTVSITDTFVRPVPCGFVEVPVTTSDALVNSSRISGLHIVLWQVLKVPSIS